jgi:hypothetical protein
MTAIVGEEAACCAGGTFKLTAPRMSALGQKQTFDDLTLNVCFWGQSGHRQVPDPES